MLQILVTLTEGPRHGYGIMVEAERLTGRGRLGPGTLYRSIRRLLDAGMIAETEGSDNEDERRRYYELTSKGRGVAATEIERLAELVDTARRNGLLTGRMSPESQHQ
jgi:DNA-binding PadR family transcriptional regulator